MQVNANGHVQRSAAEWRGIIERYRQSGMGMKDFCAQEGLTLRTLNCSGKTTGSSVNSLGTNLSAGCRCPMPASCHWQGSSRPERRQKTPLPLETALR